MTVWKVETPSGTWERVETDYAKKILLNLMEIQVAGPLTVRRVDTPPPPPKEIRVYLCPKGDYESESIGSVQAHMNAAHKERKAGKKSP